MEDAEAIVDMNNEKYAKEVEETIDAILMNWELGDAMMAGRAYGHFWDMLMTYPAPADYDNRGKEQQRRPRKRPNSPKINN